MLPTLTKPDQVKSRKPIRSRYVRIGDDVDGDGDGDGNDDDEVIRRRTFGHKLGFCQALLIRCMIASQLYIDEDHIAEFVSVFRLKSTSEQAHCVTNLLKGHDLSEREYLERYAARLVLILPCLLLICVAFSSFDRVERFVTRADGLIDCLYAATRVVSLYDCPAPPRPAERYRSLTKPSSTLDSER